MEILKIMLPSKSSVKQGVLKQVVVNKQAVTNKQAIAKAVAVLQAGGLVIYPTETVYGAGVDASNPAAVDKLLAYKSRREGKPLSVAVTDRGMAKQYVEVNQQAAKLYQQFLPGPMTVISKIKTPGEKNTSAGGMAGCVNIANGVASEFDTLGIRIFDYPLMQKIIASLGRPITATSANASGKKRPYTVADVLDNLSQKQKNLIDLIIDAGELPPNPPSMVIDTTLSTPVIFRERKEGEDGYGKGEKKSKVARGNHKDTKKDAIRKKLMQTDEKITLQSKNPAETRSIAGRIILKHWDTLKKQGLVIGLNGPLGVGKTIFAKGVAKFLQINEPITSPTYNYINEYDFERHGIKGKLFHLDMWKIDRPAEFDLLKIPSLLKPRQVVIVEWWQQIADFWPSNQAKQLPLIIIDINELASKKLTRQLIIKEKTLG